jgi:hypothetical protein
MPDHFHFLIEGTTLASDLLAMVKAFRIKTSRAYFLKTNKILWQKKYYDHILRGHDVPEAVAWYIWLNPVRKGLASVPGEFPFAGSFSGLVARLKTAPKTWTPPWRLQKAPASEGGRYMTAVRGN